MPNPFLPRLIGPFFPSLSLLPSSQAQVTRPDWVISQEFLRQRNKQTTGQTCPGPSLTLLLGSLQPDDESYEK